MSKKKKNSNYITNPNKVVVEKRKKVTTKRSLDNPNNVRVNYINAEQRIYRKRKAIALTIELLIILLFIVGGCYCYFIEGIDTKSFMFIATMIWTCPTIIAILYMFRGKHGIFDDLEDMKKIKEEKEEIRDQINQNLICNLEKLGFKNIEKHQYTEPLNLKNETYEFKYCFGYSDSDKLFDKCEMECRQVGGHIDISGDTLTATMIAETDDMYIRAEWWLRERCMYISTRRDNKDKVVEFFESVKKSY